MEFKTIPILTKNNHLFISFTDIALNKINKDSFFSGCFSFWKVSLNT